MRRVGGGAWALIRDFSLDRLKEKSILKDCGKGTTSTGRGKVSVPVFLGGAALQRCDKGLVLDDGFSH